MSVSFFTNENSPELNVSNSNFWSLMELLGYDNPEPCGTMAGGELLEFLVRIETKLAELATLPELDGGRESTTDIGSGGVTFIDCGRPEGYYTERLYALLGIVQQAIDSGTAVTWC